MVQKALNLQPDRIEVSYVPPKNTAREQIYRLIKQRVLEKVRDVLEPIAFTAARRLIAGVAYAYNREVSLPSTKKNRYADEHGLPAQRFYNVRALRTRLTRTVCRPGGERASFLQSGLTAATPNTRKSPKQKNPYRAPHR